MQNDIKSKISNYYKNLPESVFPSHLKDRATVILSGSAGWDEIEEGKDEKADWDLHIILDNDDYREYVRLFGPNYVIDDHQHKPDVFGHIKSKLWFLNKLDSTNSLVWPLYLWIFTRCKLIQDSINIKSLVDNYKIRFNDEIDSLRKQYFVKFSTYRLNLASSAKRGILTAVGVGRGEMVKFALQTFCLIHKTPYPYNKWLAKQVIKISEDGEKIVELCNKCMFETNIDAIKEYAKCLRDEMELQMQKVVGDQRWIKHWWEFMED